MVSVTGSSMVGGLDGGANLWIKKVLLDCVLNSIAGFSKDLGCIKSPQDS